MAPDGRWIAFDSAERVGSERSHLDHRRRRRHATPDHDWTGFSDGPQVVARRPVDLFLEPSQRCAEYLACANVRVAQPGTGDANRQRLCGIRVRRRNEPPLPAGERRLSRCSSRPLTGTAAPRTLVELRPIGGLRSRLGGKSSTWPAIRARSRRFACSSPVTGRDRLLGLLEYFYRGASHVNLAASEDGSTIVFKGNLRRGSDLMLIENFR